MKGYNVTLINLKGEKKCASENHRNRTGYIIYISSAHK